MGHGGFLSGYDGSGNAASDRCDDAERTHVEVSEEVSAEVGRLIAAREEVERAIDFPRRPAATPV